VIHFALGYPRPLEGASASSSPPILNPGKEDICVEQVITWERLVDDTTITAIAITTIAITTIAISTIATIAITTIDTIAI
jgi:hypothetical protein